MPSLRCLITAGPTREHLDPVRYLSNGSSGKMGYALAAAALERGFAVDLVTGPVSLTPPAGAVVHRVTSAAEMAGVCEGLFPACDAFIAVAAVADYRPKATSPQKLKKADRLILELEPTIDILKMLGARKRPDQSVIGFAAETTDVEASARRKLAEKNLDWIVANEVGRAGLGMESDSNAVTLLSRNGRRVTLPAALKTELARSIMGELFFKE